MKGSLKGKRNTRKKPLKLFQKAMATILLLVSLTGYTACQQPPKNPDDDVVIVDPSNPSNQNNGNTQGGNQGENQGGEQGENQGGEQGENQGGEQGGNQGENPDNPIVDPDHTPIEEVTYVELLTTYEQALNMFIDELATQVMADQNINEEDVTEYSCDFLGGQATNTSVSSLNLEIKTETTTYKIAVTFDSPLTYTAISYFDTADAKGEPCSKAISEATSEIVEEIKDQQQDQTLKFEDLTAEQQATINENLESVFIEVMNYVWKGKYETRKSEIQNYKWDFGNADSNGCYKNLKLYCETKSSTSGAVYIYNVDLNEAKSINFLKDNVLSYSDYEISYNYGYGYTLDRQTEHLDIINAISAKLAEADNTFDYAGARVIQGSWGSAVSDTYGTVAIIPLVYISNNQIKEVRVAIKSSGTDDAYYANILSYLNQGKWYYGIEKDIALSDNQLAEIDLTTQTTNENS